MTALPTFDPGFTTPEMTAVFSADARVAAMLRFEAALAHGEAAAGIVPPASAEAIAAACEADVADAPALLAAGWEAGTPLVPLLEHLEASLDPAHARWLHHGATSQDAVDTALVLQMRSGLDVLIADLCRVGDHLAALATEHAATPMMARTFLQHAVPTTFGMRAAQWLDPVVRHVGNARTAAALLPVQLGGPSGCLAILGDHATEVLDTVAAELGLVAPPVAWHTDRSRVALVVALVERIARTMAKIGADLTLLAQTDVGEVRMRPGGSSSMPHKRNPIDAVRAVAAADACSGNARVVTAGRGHELERGIGGWHAEWLAVPMVFHTSAAAVAAIGRALGSLEVDAARMAANLGDADAAPAATATALIARVLEAYQDAVGAL